jgi:hypothetical protein
LEVAVTSTNITDDVRRIVLLGASNLSLGWPQLMRVVFDRWNGPLQILTAHGMGRSYVASSQFGWRTAPGILDCGLWSEFAGGDQIPPSAALITDLGNDLVYGRTPAEVVQAAADACGRLREANSDCRIVVTRPPLKSVESLSWLRYYFFRTVIFPMCQLSLAEIVDASHDLDHRIQQLAGVTVVSQQREWFGADPIHVRRCYRESAFASFLASWPVESTDAERASMAPVERPSMEICRVLGRERTCQQPSVTTDLGSVSAW